jgi:hypothetical protein
MPAPMINTSAFCTLTPCDVDPPRGFLAASPDHYGHITTNNFSKARRYCTPARASGP